MIYFSMGLLGEMVAVLNQCFVAEDRDNVMEILAVLGRSLQFSLSLCFLDEAERRAVRLCYTIIHMSLPAVLVTHLDQVF